jgi:virginiamycin B lyase
VGRPLVRWLCGCSIGLLAALLLPAAALAIDEFPLPNAASGPAGITTGPDGAVWFTEEQPGPTAPGGSGGNRIGRITTSGAITEVPIPTTSAQPAEITTGPDGAIWFTEFGKSQIGRLDPATNSITEYPVLLGSGPDGITVGPDGALWFTEFQASQIGRITTDGTVTHQFPTPSGTSGPSDITTGPDGRLWFTEALGNKIGAVSPSNPTTGGISEFGPTADDPSGITSSFGALWYTASSTLGGGNKIGRISTTGAIQEFEVPTPNSDPSGITTGSDGALWFTEVAGNKVGRMTTGGSFTEFPLPNSGSGPEEITSGPDGALWFTEQGVPSVPGGTDRVGGNRIGRIVPASVPGTPAGGSAPPPAGGSSPGASTGTSSVRIPSSLLTKLPSSGGSTKRKCRVPKLRGLSVRKAKKKLRRAHCRYRIRGKGRVVSTRPKARTRTSKRVVVRAKRKRRRS